jgi:phage recombination protein Bet
MNALVPLRPTGGLTHRDSRRLSLFAKTAGKELRGAELDEAVEWCEIYGANPFTKDIYFFVFDPAKDTRRVVPVLSVGLYRKIAARSGSYRPADKPPTFTYDEAAVGPTNPRGLTDCTVTVYKLIHGEWHPVVGHVRWAERAPIKEKWADQGNGRREPTGEFALDPKKPNWTTMPETMLAKCAEVDAIRKGWPNETAGSYIEDELNNVIELTVSEVIERTEAERRMDLIGGASAIMVAWNAGDALERVPAGQFADRVLAFIREHMKPGEEEASVVLDWAKRNAASLREFWATDKDGSLALKAEIEKVETWLKTAA